MTDAEQRALKKQIAAQQERVVALLSRMYRETRDGDVRATILAAQSAELAAHEAVRRIGQEG